MRKPATLVLSALVSAVLLMPATADASHDRGSDFSIRSLFDIGGLSVAFAYGSHARYAPAYYYRFPRPVAYRGVHCTDRCFVDHGRYYHHPACPVASHYFRSHHFDPGHFWARSAPRVDYPRHYHRPPAHHWVPPGHRKHGHHWVPPGHRKHGGRDHYKHDRRRDHRHGPDRDHRGRRDWHD